LEIQIINLSLNDVFKKFSDEYKVYRDIYQPGLLGLEIRNLNEKLAQNVQKIVLKEKEICYKIENSETKLSSIFIPGTLSNIKEISRKILTKGDDDLGYKISNFIKNYEDYELKSYKIGNKEFSFNKSYVMGILNITPDSFSDGGKYLNSDYAIKHALDMIAEGADFIDIGGESTRPGSESIPTDEEIKRVVPVIDGILSKNPNVIISVDTTKSKVAELSLAHGAKIINDISSFTFVPKMIEIVMKYNAGFVLMHMQGVPKNMQNNPQYGNLIKEIYDFLYEKLILLNKYGVKKIFIDPGIGFGKNVEDNFEIIKRLGDFKSLGSPVLIGVSRKAFIGKSLGLEVMERDTATAIVEAIAVKNGAKIIRTHNVKYGSQICNLLNHL
jgi:dihydropteroate synthase